MVRIAIPFRELTCFVTAFAWICTALHALGADQSAAQILKATKTSGGLIVHLGCGDGKLTSDLHAGGRFIVHGLAPDANDVRRTRQRIQNEGKYGRVSAQQFIGPRLPYADNLVNLLVAEELGQVTQREALRVLAPGGKLYVRRDEDWLTITKPRPDNIDEWTHYLYDAGGNPVSHDQVVGPPGHLQWLDEPQHTRSHEHIPGIYALVSSGGKIFYIADEAPIASIRHTPKWQLIARDAFNGVVLWKMQIHEWFPHIVNWGQTPRQLQCKLVAINDRVYVSLGLHAPISVVDAATGEVVSVLENTYGAEEILCHQGTLLCVKRTVTEAKIAELKKWTSLVSTDDSPVFDRDTAEPLVKRLRSAESTGEVVITAIDTRSEQETWSLSGESVASLRINSLSALKDRVFYQSGGSVVCADLSTGKKRWMVASPPMRVIGGDAVICADGKTITARSVDTGEVRWSHPTTVVEVRDVFVTGGHVWVGGFKPFPEKRGPSWGPYFVTKRDLATGDVLMHVEPENPGHHHRCYSNKATDRFILGGRRGTEFIDLQSGDVLWNSWARGVCKYGVMPGNGLLYVPPHACGCYITAKLTGFNALAPRVAPTEEDVSDEQPPLYRGPAYDAPPASSVVSPSGEWPTYRSDVQRSGVASATVATSLKQQWQVEIGRNLTSPTSADGKVFVASIDQHRVSAIESDSGRETWRYTANARVDSPPTIFEGQAVFGSRDGHVYSVRVSDGELAWRLRPAGKQRWITVNGQLESAHRVHGSVLVDDGVLFLTAGKSSYMDGGITLCRVAPRTGELLSRAEIYSPDRLTGKQPDQYGPNSMPGVLSDILSSDGQHVYLRDSVFDKQGSSQPEGAPHLFTLTGFLDGSWAHRSYWIFGTECSLSTGCSGQAKGLVYGRLMVFNDSSVFGFGRSKVHWSNQLQDGAYRLFALNRKESSVQWEKTLPIQVRAMLLAGDTLFVAGSPNSVIASWSAAEPRDQAGELLAISSSTGGIVARYPLDAPPVIDGMAAANGRLYLALENGQLTCLTENRSR